jgi:DivIVA domain-containing protein
MPLLPEEVRRHRFGLSLWGYRREEVHLFLGQVAADYELAIAAIAEVEAGLPRRDDVDALLRGTLESAQGLRRAAALVALGDRLEVEPLLEGTADVMERAATLLEAAREEVDRLRARADERGPDGGGAGDNVARPV